MEKFVRAVKITKCIMGVLAILLGLIALFTNQQVSPLWPIITGLIMIIVTYEK